MVNLDYGNHKNIGNSGFYYNCSSNEVEEERDLGCFEILTIEPGCKSIGKKLWSPL